MLWLTWLPVHILWNLYWFCAHVLQWACRATKLSVSPDQRISPASVRHCSFSDHEFFQPCKLANMVFLFGVISPSHSCWRCLDQSGLVALESIWNYGYWFSVKCRQKIELSANRATWRENAFRVLNPPPSQIHKKGLLHVSALLIVRCPEAQTTTSNTYKYDNNGTPGIA